MDTGNSKAGLSVASPLMPETKKGLGTYNIKRPVYLEEQVHILGGYQVPEKKRFHEYLRCLNEFNAWKFIQTLIPILKWLPEYSIKKYLFSDIMAGITVAIMQVPQGMAYAMLAGIMPVCGLYMAFFPVLVYVFFGTSKHISTGTFAIVSIMSGKVVREYATEDRTLEAPKSLNITGDPLTAPAEVITAAEVVTALTMVVGLYLLIMYVLRLGAISAFLSEALINGFTSACAVTVLVTQFKDLLGIKIPKHSGLFGLVMNIYEVALGVPRANVATVTVSAVCITIMALNNELLKPRVAKITRVPIPIELMCAVGGTITSYLLDLSGVYDIQIVGHIPTGLPYPQLPKLHIMRLVMIDAIAITAVSYSIVLSMALIFARRYKYTIKANQELLALGLGDVLGSVFFCLPSSCSLTRTLLQAQCGGKTQFANIVSAFLVLMVLLFLAPFLELLPRCCLASIVVVALKGMFLRFADFRIYWRQGFYPSITWLGTFIGVIIIGIDIGLLIGAILAIVNVYVAKKSKTRAIGVIPNTDLYVDLETHTEAREVPHIKIIQHSGAIIFQTASSTRKCFYDKLGIDEKVVKELGANIEDGQIPETSPLKDLQFIILDLSTVPSIDATGCDNLRMLRKEFALCFVTVVLAGANDDVLHVIRRFENLGEAGTTCFVKVEPVLAFPTIHDAVTHIQFMSSSS